MPSPSPVRLATAAPLLPDQVWRVEQLATAPEPVLPTGFAGLDRLLPGAGWPVGSLIELLQEHPALHVWQLLLPALLGAVAQQPGPVALVGPPCLPFGPSLAGQGLPADRLLCVYANRPAGLLWAAEQGLRSGEVAAVLAWLPRAKATELRRLHLAAQQQQRLLFVFRRVAARNEASPARLRILVEGAEAISLQILKRRGPPVDTALELPAHPAGLAALLAARNGQGRAPAPSNPPERRSHGLDRFVALA